MQPENSKSIIHANINSITNLDNSIWRLFFIPFFKEPFDKRWMRSFLEETVFSGIFFSSNVWILWVQRGYNFMALKVVHVFVLSKLLNHHACVCDFKICHKKNKKIIQIFQPFMLNWLENVTNMLIWFSAKCPPICELGTNHNCSLFNKLDTLVQKLSPSCCSRNCVKVSHVLTTGYIFFPPGLYTKSQGATSFLESSHSN